jgi:hypothetical protein
LRTIPLGFIFWNLRSILQASLLISFPWRCTATHTHTKGRIGKGKYSYPGKKARVNVFEDLNT